jgi:hypothetical protein
MKEPHKGSFVFYSPYREFSPNHSRFSPKNKILWSKVHFLPSYSPLLLNQQIRNKNNNRRNHLEKTGVLSTRKTG